MLVGATIHVVHMHAFINRDSKQQRIDIILIKDKWMDMWWAIAFWFNFSRIPTNTVGNIVSLPLPPLKEPIKV